MLHRLLPLLIIIALVGYLAFNFQSFKRNIAYKLHLSGDPTTSCCTPDTISKTGNFDENASVAIFDNQPVSYPKTSLAEAFQQSQNSVVLGTTTNAAGDEKWIEVSLKD